MKMVQKISNQSKVYDDWTKNEQADQSRLYKILMERFTNPKNWDVVGCINDIRDKANTIKCEVWDAEVVAVIDYLLAELAQRPATYCCKDHQGRYATHPNCNHIALFNEPPHPDVVDATRWTIEIYTGQQVVKYSHEKTS